MLLSNFITNDLSNIFFDYRRSKYIELDTGLIINVNDGAIVSRVGKKDVKILSMLIEFNGELVSREKLLEAGWDGRIVSDNVLNVSISNIRKLLSDFYPNDKKLLYTINGLGCYLMLES